VTLLGVRLIKHLLFGGIAILFVTVGLFEVVFGRHEFFVITEICLVFHGLKANGQQSYEAAAGGNQLRSYILNIILALRLAKDLGA